MTSDSRRQTSATRSDPTLDPAGTVRMHPDDRPDDPTARRVIKTADGRWCALTHPQHATIPEEPEELGAWPAQPLTHLGLVLSRATRTTSRGRARRGRAERLPAGHHVPTPRGGTAEQSATPSFWEVAKAYCRAFIRTDDRLKEYERRAHRDKR
ncbi:hypothetical protein [Actinopolyspora saharensis]|uniref:Uncharacterized protein n=1 Tax=Actinopolyspora saharensis TaxID=995062 RepID=A0A1H0Z6J8_9ACTN|nr:hypothetical protein [Actinopolyspora saharensis]SDQ22920.1 hypothetical protein SAMN04489718_0867 [Actinopolyspora saharensis]